MLKYLKPFAALVLVCLALLFGQAMCDLSLPNLMSDIVNVGVQQGGLEAGLPEAMSAQGMELLQCFLTEDEREQMDGLYNTIGPESSESQRFAEQYPLIRKESVCILREDVTEEGLKTGGELYGKSSYALLLYLQKAGAGKEPGDAAQEPMEGRAVSGVEPEIGPESGGEGESSTPEGYLGTIPEDALFHMPGTESSALPEEEEKEGLAEAAPESGAEASLPETGQPETSQPGSAPVGEGAGDGDMDGLSGIEPGRLYALTPLISRADKETLAEVTSAADESASMMGDQVGVVLKRMFYRELGIDTDAIRSGYIWRTGGKMLGVALLGVIAAVLVGFFASRIASTVGKRLRHDIFAKVESFGNGEFDRFSTASLITRTTNDVQQVQMLVTMGIRMVCYAPIIGIGGVVFAVQKSVSMSWIVAAAVVALIGLIAVSMSLALPKFKALQKLMDRLNLVSRENLSGMMVVRAFQNEGYEEERFARANGELADTHRYVQRVMSCMMPAMMFIMNLVSIVIVWVGGHAIAESTLQIGDMMAFIQYAMQIIMAFLMIAAMFVMVPRASVSAVRIQEVLDTSPAVTDPEEAVTLGKAKGVVEFKDVSFRYGGAESNVLEHISFTALPGQTTAIIGATGAGKSTLLNLIPRFYDVTEGEIDLDGVDIRKLSQKELRQAVGYVPQRGILFSGTVASNIRYGKEDASGEEIDEALETAQAKDFVDEMWEGAESPVSQGGTNVSGGQRQRLSIARALVRKAPVYLFDDSFSALDFKTDAALRRALKEKTADAAVIIVAQRVSTIMHAQQILVLDGGRIVGKGTHEELLKSCPEYREIAESQLQKEGTK